MSDSERNQLAQDTINKVFGINIPAEALEGEPDSAADFRRIMFEHAFADSWSRDGSQGLDLKTRSLITVAILATLGQERELRTHVGGALKLGATPDEIVDLFIHLGAYAGVARAGSGFTIASDALVKFSKRAAPKPAE
ncbi:MAG: carboxymuconolactone decarboxylase family protein [Acidimicrobiia bacterium]|nr:carboxymuconolactone decarboxylase family protein [Acidimicrobiia bacterium]